jgi:beta-galactosidase
LLWIGSSLNCPASACRSCCRRNWSNWNGWGAAPWENYSDRNRSALVGRWHTTVSADYVPYILPQEYGNKTDVRWLRLHDGKSTGVKFTAAPTMEASASHFTAADLYAAKHTTDLTSRPEVHVNLDSGQRGLGTASCGPDTLPQYRIPSGKYQLNFTVSSTDGASREGSSPARRLR